MKVKSIETFTRGHVSVVRVRTDDGAEGYGQIAPYHADISAMVLHRQVAPHALGADASKIAALVERIVEAEYKFPGSYVCRAVGGLDTALWDLHGKLQRRSVCELIGGRPRPVAVYGSSMRRDITPEREASRLVRLREALGYQAFKVRIGKVCGHDADEWPGRTPALVAAVRKALGPDVALLVDANSCYTAEKAIEIGKMLEQHGVGHFEEPCPYWELEWTAEVARALRVPVAGGEQDTDLAQFRRMVNMRAVDIVQPDICYVGGLSRACQVAVFAASAGLPCVPHSANRSLVTVFTLHMLAAIPNAGPYLEYSIEPDHWADEIFTPALEVRGGHVAIPPGPGWGVTVRPEWLSQAEHAISQGG